MKTNRYQIIVVFQTIQKTDYMHSVLFFLKYSGSKFVVNLKCVFHYQFTFFNHTWFQYFCGLLTQGTNQTVIKMSILPKWNNEFYSKVVSTSNKLFTISTIKIQVHTVGVQIVKMHIVLMALSSNTVIKLLDIKQI